jgi:hypothetical protein
MHNHILVNLLAFYGLFLIASGIVAVTFIGTKAKTALISGGTSGLLSLGISCLIYQNFTAAKYAGLVLSFALFCVFAWRCTMTLFKLFELIPVKHPELKGKGIAFLIIAQMAIVSIVVSLIQVAIF